MIKENILNKIKIVWSGLLLDFSLMHNVLETNWQSHFVQGFVLKSL
jgi:hypothetical protein